MKKRIFNTLLQVIALLFITFYFILSYYNRLPYEDYHFISMTKDMGVIKAMLNQYSITNNFSREYDGRITQIIEDDNSKKNTLFFEPLVPSGRIYSDNLSEHLVSNNYFENFYSLDFPVAVKKFKKIHNNLKYSSSIR